MVLDWIPDPADLWRSHKRASYTMPLTPTDLILQQKVQLAKMHPEIRQYPLLVHQGDVPVHLVGTPQPSSTYQPVPVKPFDNSDPSTHLVVHNAEGPTFTAQGEVRDHLIHPFHHLGYTLTHHPIQFLEDLAAYVRHGVGWVVSQYTDWFDQIQHLHWDGSWDGFRQLSTFLWRTAVVGGLTFGMVEAAPLLQALAVWLRLVFDFIRGALGLVGAAVDELWYLLRRIWIDVSSLIPSF